MSTEAHCHFLQGKFSLPFFFNRGAFGHSFLHLNFGPSGWLMPTDRLTATSHNKMDEWCFTADDASPPARWRNSPVSRTVVSNCFSQLHINRSGTVGVWVGGVALWGARDEVRLQLCWHSDRRWWLANEMPVKDGMKGVFSPHCIYNTIDESFLLCAWWEWHQMDIDLAVSIFLCGVWNQHGGNKLAKALQKVG